MKTVIFTAVKSHVYCIGVLANNNQSLILPLILDIQEFYNKKKVPPTNKEEYERDLALALLEVEPVPVTESGSDIMGK